MGSALGTLKAAARRAGVTLAEYESRRALGQKWCYRCDRWKAIDSFGADRHRTDGRAAVCRQCRETPKEGPPRDERIAQAQFGRAWCRDCRDWNPIGDVRNGRCGTHNRQRDREKYRTDEAYRHRKLTRSAVSRGRGAPPPLAQQADIIERFEGLCAYCQEAPPTSWDHIVPVSKGGRTTPGNIVPACLRCNSSKCDRDVDEWMASKGYVASEALFEVILMSYAGLLG